MIRFCSNGVVSISKYAVADFSIDLCLATEEVRHRFMNGFAKRSLTRPGVVDGAGDLRQVRPADSHYRNFEQRVGESQRTKLCARCKKRLFMQTEPQSCAPGERLRAAPQFDESANACKVGNCVP